MEPNNNSNNNEKEAYIIYIQKRSVTLNSRDMIQIMNYIRNLQEYKKIKESKWKEEE